MIKTKTFYFNDLRECTYVVWDDTRECVIIDPGCQSDSERERLKKFIETNNLKPVKLLNTHGHFDHVMGNAFVTKTWGVKTYINPQDKPQLERAFSYGEMFGYSIEQPPADTVDVNDGDKIGFGESYLKVITTPGHTRGGVCYYTEEQDNKIVFAGDSLFAGSIGRTDLPGGDYDDLMNSLLKKIVELGGDYKVLSGHGPETTISRELDTNPFLRYE
ncbi:MAG: MBL fold metallo-hydrolase [Bacteroidales bacterium]|nr:MBL fold metallo-hydrolase [Bacteroidales bacterium]